MTDFVVVIPARYASVRLPGKPLRDIAGKPMIQHVYERERKVPRVKWLSQRMISASRMLPKDSVPRYA